MDLSQVITSFCKQEILILGDVMLDEYIWGEVRRISPEAPIPVVEIQRRTYRPGGAANTAANVVALSGKADLGGVLGQDFQADLFLQSLQELGVQGEGLQHDRQRPTTTKTRILAHSQQVGRLDLERRSPITPELEHQILQWVISRLSQVKGCILSDYGKGVASPSLTQNFIRLAQQQKLPIVIDPKGTDYIKYSGATVITPNVAEVQQALHCEIGTEADLLEAGQRLLELLAGTAVLITRGAEGMSLFQLDRPVLHFPAVARHVFDVTGAGDTVVSTLALALATGTPLETATTLSNWAAGLVVGKVGTATVSLPELISALPLTIPGEFTPSIPLAR